MLTTFEEIRASGRAHVDLATELLQRVRLADPIAGVWEAADVQWWWGRPRASDAVDQSFWLDADGPIAGVLLTELGDTWQLDPLVLPGFADSLLPEVWARGLALVESLSLTDVTVLTHESDAKMLSLLAEAGFESSEQSAGGVTWMLASDVPDVPMLRHGYRLTNRGHAASGPHWLAVRNGAEVEGRLRECSLYDAELDLAVEAPSGEIAGYGLFWFDPVTRVGMVEPMRTEEAHQRRGLARALLANGLHRLAGRGAKRMKVGYDTAIARSLYTGSGFQLAGTTREYRRRRT